MKSPKCSHHNLTDVEFCRNYNQMMSTHFLGCKISNLPESNPLNQCVKLLPKIDALVSVQELFNSFFPYIAQNIISQIIPRERKYITKIFSFLLGYTTLTQRLRPGKGQGNHHASKRQSIG